MSVDKQPSDLTKKMAKLCEVCPVCRSARKNQEGFNYWFVKNVDSKVCPFCQAYEKVHGRKAFEPIS